MKSKKFKLSLIIAILIANCIQAQVFHHEIKAFINTKEKSIEVTDSIKFPSVYMKNVKDTFSFYLNSNFKLISLDPNTMITEIKSDYLDSSSDVSVKKYMVQYPSSNYNKQFILPVYYKGKVEGDLKKDAADYARGFSQTSGIISDDGIYLAGSTFWIPNFNDSLFNFNLTVLIDSSMSVVSQGTRTKNEINQYKKNIRYELTEPTDEAYLIAGKWTEYNKKFSNILVQAFLMHPDTALANKYLGITGSYLTLYDKLIGPYPYTKFALVENFWETGFGMPSFTLLGEKVIRFPFILYSSYPHELLHNYWGNSVYVDIDSGNWCEGITAYMADHLLKEQAGQGAEYRRVTLQKYTDFVNDGNDFPVTQFISRNNSAEEAIGYGKVLMIYEMLRYKFGDAVFRKAFADFYKDNKFRRASFNDIMKSFEKVTGQDLNSFFDQWLNRTGAPTLKLSDVEVFAKKGQFELSFTLSQVQKDEPFNINIPVAIYLENVDSVTIKNLTLSQREEKFTFSFDKRPTRIDVDPQFNVFRRLDKGEVPPTFSQIFGDTDAVIILPKKSNFLKEYTDMAEHWQQTQEVQGCKLKIIYDSDLNELPDKTTWIVGFENKFASGLNVLNNYLEYFPKKTIEQLDTMKKDGALVYAFKNPQNKMFTNGFIGSNNQAMIKALKIKMTHYTKYSYLGFIGDRAENKLKGEFPVIDSPLNYSIKYDNKTIPITATIKPRKALMY